jgi:hypothetical protein
VPITGKTRAGASFRIGRQEMAFDLQRFVSIRDGPNVRQAYDAAWLDWEKDAWRVISFWSHPVIYVPQGVFNDYSNSHFQYGGTAYARASGPSKYGVQNRNIEVGSASLKG